MARSLSFSLVVLIGVFLLGTAAGSEVKRRGKEGSDFIGAAGCSSSSCHGGAGEKRSQYITWAGQDFHSRAYSILLDARSARIAEAVGVASAQSSPRCTVCHSPFQAVPKTRLAPSAHADEGVSCESCHGAAGPWLRGHTRPDWTYAMRVSAGMRDLRNLYLRANACVACHQNLDHDILRAGHPGLIFELDSQSINEPRHWKETDQWIGPRSWLTGQAVALREMSWALQAKRTGRKNNELLSRWSGLAALLDETGSLSGASTIEPRLVQRNAFGAVQQRADEMARRAARTPWTLERVRQLTVEISSQSPTDAETATRLVLALESLTRALAANQGPPLPVSLELKALREDVQSGYNFDASRFAEDLNNLRKKFGSGR